MQTSDSPSTLTVRCRPTDFELARKQLELNGYRLVSCETEVGALLLTGAKTACTCELCRPLEVAE